MRRLHLLAALAAVFVAADASAFVVGSGVTVGASYVTGGTQFNGGSVGSLIGRSFAGDAVARTVTVSDQVRLVTSTGANATATLARVVTAAELAAGVVGLGAAAYAGCAAGTAIANYAGMGSAGNGSRTGCNVTDWLFDAGQASQTMSRYQPKTMAGNNIGPVVYGSQSDACNAPAVHAYISNNYPGTYHTSTVPCEFKLYNSTNGQFQTNFYISAPLLGTGQACPASIDALNPAWSVAAGSAPGPDGLCPTGRYAPMTAAQANARLAQYGQASAMAPMAEDLVSRGGKIDQAAAPQVTTVSPTTVQGQPSTSTTTKSDGTVQTETKTPVTTLTPSGDKIQETTTTTTVTNTCVGTGACSPSNASSSTTNVTTAPAAKSEQAATDCEKFPDSIGCAKFGTPAADDKLVRKPIAVTVSPVVFGDGGSCPGNRTFSVVGKSYTVSFSAICDATSAYVRPFVLLAGGILAAYIFVGGLKT